MPIGTQFMPGRRMLHQPHVRRPRLLHWLCLLSALWATPVVASPPLPPPQDAWDTLAQQAATCLGREDPACANLILPELERIAPEGAQSVAFWHGIVDFLDGRFGQAQGRLRKIAAQSEVPAALRERAASYADMAEASAELLAASKPYKLAGGKVIAWIRPGPDEVLIGYLDNVLGKALPKLQEAFGPLTGTITLHVYPRADDLAEVSGLTVQQIRTSGTIALCKHNRVMITSPQDLVFGYPWADTVVHELVHWFVIKRGGAQVPVWLHEGLARSLQGCWRGVALGELDRDERAVLAAARKKGAFISLQRMHPSLAVLTSQDETQLAFAEVHHAVAWLLARAAQRLGQVPSGAQGLGRIVALFGQGLEEAAVLHQAAGLNAAAFQAAWRRDLGRLDLRDLGEAVGARVPLMFRAVSAPVALAGSSDVKRFAELGDRLALLGRPQAAAIEYKKALAAGPQQGPVVVTRLVRVLLDVGAVGPALDYLQPSLATFLEHAPLFVLAGRAAALQSRWKDALEFLERAAWLNPFDPAIHALSAQAWAALGQPGEAAAARARQALVDTAGL